jgi:hypothetical protein
MSTAVRGEEGASVGPRGSFLEMTGALREEGLTRARGEVGGIRPLPLRGPAPAVPRATTLALGEEGARK